MFILLFTGFGATCIDNEVMVYGTVAFAVMLAVAGCITLVLIRPAALVPIRISHISLPPFVSTFLFPEILEFDVPPRIYSFASICFTAVSLSSLLPPYVLSHC